MNATVENKLKILWISHNPLPPFADALGVNKAISGGWLVTLAAALVNSGKICLGVVSDVPGVAWTHKSLGGVENYVVPTPKRRQILLRPTKTMIGDYRRVVKEFNPDVVNIHGTEGFFGLLSAEGHLDRPTVISIQGIIDYHRRQLLGGISILDILKTRTLRDWLLFDGLFEQKLRWDSRAVIERKIFSGNSAFIGRTLWDRAHLRRLNPDADYFHCHEMVQKRFFEREWSLSDANRHSIFAPSASYPLKGFHVLVRAVAILRHEFPDVRVRVPLASFMSETGIKGAYLRMRRGGYANYLANLIDRLGVVGHITALGSLSGDQMAEEMRSAHVFALNSFAENSPNSMAEALTIGVPSVVSLVGGVPNLIDDGKTALGFPPGDGAVLAEQIRRIFRDDDLAMRLSRAAKETARPRYSPGSIVPQMVAIYQAIARGDHPESLEALGEKEA